MKRETNILYLSLVPGSFHFIQELQFFKPLESIFAQSVKKIGVDMIRLQGFQGAVKIEIKFRFSGNKEHG